MVWFVKLKKYQDSARGRFIKLTELEKDVDSPMIHFVKSGKEKNQDSARLRGGGGLQV